MKLTILSLLILMLAGALHAQEDLFGPNSLLDDFQLDEEPVQDYEKLRLTYMSELAYWPYVAVVHRSWRKAEDRHDWEQVNVSGLGDRLFVKPMSDKPLVNMIEVPEAGKYRIWLGYVAETKQVHRATVSFSGANAWKHRFGKQLTNETGDRMEKSLPIRFDSEIGRMAAQIHPVAIWEFVDVELQAGTTRVEIQAEVNTVRLDSLVITQSKTFVPSKSSVVEEANLTKVWYRYRYTEPVDASVTAVSLGSFVRYVWAHYKPGSLTQIWYSSMGSIVNREDGGPYVPVGEWSDWVEVREVTTNGGRYLTDTITASIGYNNPVGGGTLEVQAAWFPHEGAVLKTTVNPVDERGRTVYLVPVDRTGGYRTPATEADASTGVWGTRHAEYLGWFLSERGAIERLMEDIEKEVDLQETTEQMPWRIRLFTTCRVSPSAYDVAVPLLKRFGINWIPHLSMADKQRFGLHLEDSIYQQGGTVVIHSHDPMDPLYDDGLMKGNYGLEALASKLADDPDYLEREHWLKMGDEIGKVTSPTHINGLPDCRREYLEYMQRAAEAAGSDASFFGVASYEDLWYGATYGAKAPGLTLPERRHYYHDKRFGWWFTAMFHKRHSDTARTHLPNLLTRCNYTPAGPMFAGDMDYSNWFALPRYNASTAHSSEDWLSAGGGYTSQAGVQTQGFYAELVASGARPNDLPMDFIMVGRSGELDRKLPVLVGSGIYQIYAYDWGPEYTRGAVDTWSHVFRTYEQLGRGARAVGAAEDLLIDGEREPARVALLYNRTHEIWHAGEYGIFSDRLFTWIALRQKHFAVEIVLEEDLTPELLSQYQVLYASGFNLLRECVAPLRQWVEAGGTLVAATGFARADEYGEPIPEITELLGATQRFGGVSKGERWMPFYISGHEPMTTVTVNDSPLTEAFEGGVIGLQGILTPTSGTPVATYADGSVAAVHQQVGNGQVLNLGFMPGMLFAANAPRDENGKPTNYTNDRRRLVTLPALRQAEPPQATYSDPLSELFVRNHPEGIAVILVDFSYAPDRPGRLTVRTDREVKEVVGTLSGPLTWQRDGDVVHIDRPVPVAADVIIVR